MVKINHYKVERITSVQCQEFDPEDFRNCEPPYEGSTDEEFLDYIEDFDWDDANDEMFEKYDIETFKNFEDEYDVDPQGGEYNMTLIDEEGDWHDQVFRNFVEWKKKQ